MELTYEKAMQQLEDIVAQLSAGSLPLEKMVQLYEKGDKLSKYCLSLLNAYDARLDRIDSGEAGEEATEMRGTEEP